jgi:hypothetical protein
MIKGPEGSYLYALSLGRGNFAVSYKGESIGNIKRKRDGSWTLCPSKYSSVGGETQTALLETGTVFVGRHLAKATF